jgi:hypothetical protein
VLHGLHDHKLGSAEQPCQSFVKSEDSAARPGNVIRLLVSMIVALVFSAVASKHCRVFAEKVVVESLLHFGEKLLKHGMFHGISHRICAGITHGISQRLGRFVS